MMQVYHPNFGTVILMTRMVEKKGRNKCPKIDKNKAEIAQPRITILVTRMMGLEVSTCAKPYIRSSNKKKKDGWTWGMGERDGWGQAMGKREIVDKT